MGLRQLRAPASRCSAARDARGRCRRRSPTPPQVHRCTGLAPSVALHIPWDAVDDYAALRRVRRGARRPARHDQQQHLPGRRLQARQPHPQRPGRASEGDRPPPRVHRRHGRDRIARPQDLARRRHQLPGPGRHARPPGPTRRVARDDLRPDRRGPATRARVQVLRAGVLPHRRARLGHVATSSAWPSASAPSSASTPATTPRAPTSSSSSCSCCGSGRLGSFDFNCRFYADDDLIVGRGRPVPAVPDPGRGGARRRLRPRERRGVHARPVPQHREEDPRPDPLGAQRPGDDGTRPARRRRGAGQGPGGRRRARRQRASSWTPSTPTSGPTSPPGARAAACPADPMAAYLASGYQEQIELDRVGGTQAGWS